MPYLRLWRYQVQPGRETDFVRAYRPDGDWARLFAASPGYLGTELLQPAPPDLDWVTIDRWVSASARQQFLADHAPAYRALDRRLAPLCSVNSGIGNFTTLTFPSPSSDQPDP